MATVMGSPGIWWRDPRTGADPVKLVHGEQDLRLLKPLPARGTLMARNRVVSITDKGAGKGAIAVLVRKLIDERTGETMAETATSRSCAATAASAPRAACPIRGPSRCRRCPSARRTSRWHTPTLPQAALLYRLSGDYNPLHADPDFAARAGFDRPILHGLCTYGMGARAVIDKVLGFDAARLRRIAVRFTSPVWPGETVRYELWRDGERVRAAARDGGREKVGRA